MKTGHIAAAIFVAGTALMGMTPAWAYRYAISDFKVVKNGAILFEDTFSDGNPPPSAPNSPDGSTNSYGGRGSFGPESGNKLTIDSSGLTISEDPNRLVQRAVLKTDTSSDPSKGLKSGHTFSVTGLFDLVVPQTSDEWYFVELRDSTSAIEGTESVKVGVMRASATSVVVMFMRKNTVTFQTTAIDQRDLDATHSQIQLTLKKASTTSNAISASYAYVDNGVVGTPTTFANTTAIFNANPFTRAAFGTSTPVVSLPPPTPTTPLPPPPTDQTVFVVPTGQMPTAAVATTATGTLGNATLTVTLDLSKMFSGGSFAALGQFAAGYNIYVLALLPSGVLGLPSATWVTLSATRGWSVLGIPVAAYMEGLAQNATSSVVISILQNLDVTGLVGTEFYIGYGTDEIEMLTSGRYRGVYKIQ